MKISGWVWSDKDACVLDLIQEEVLLEVSVLLAETTVENDRAQVHIVALSLSRVVDGEDSWRYPLLFNETLQSMLEKVSIVDHEWLTWSQLL